MGTLHGHEKTSMQDFKHGVIVQAILGSCGIFVGHGMMLVL